MSSVKRKALESKLNRRVRARRDESEELVEESENESAPPSEEGASGSEDEENASGDESESGEENSDKEGSESESESDDDSEPDEAGAISFGALAKAQASLQKSRRGKDGKSSKTSKSKRPTTDDPWMNNEEAERKAGRKDYRDFSRSSKHAPVEVSSKKAVSRRREVVPVAKRQIRDPRFEAIAGQVDDQKVNQNYSFLNDYRMDEIKALKEQIRTTKDESLKEKLKRQLLPMESKMKTELRKAKEREILDKHRKEEKKLVEQGKKPFYLKKAEQKKQLIMEQYKGLKGKQLDHVIERRRKKVEGKEKKNLPYARRDFGDRA